MAQPAHILPCVRQGPEARWARVPLGDVPPALEAWLAWRLWQEEGRVIDLDELERLKAEATPGPYRVGGDTVDLAALVIGEHGHCVADTADCAKGSTKARADAAYLAALANAAGELIRLARVGQAKMCACTYRGWGECTNCGLPRLL